MELKVNRALLARLLSPDNLIEIFLPWYKGYVNLCNSALQSAVGVTLLLGELYLKSAFNSFFSHG